MNVLPAAIKRDADPSLYVDQSLYLIVEKAEIARRGFEGALAKILAMKWELAARGE